jgi:hypothetical protein
MSSVLQRRQLQQQQQQQHIYYLNSKACALVTVGDPTPVFVVPLRRMTTSSQLSTLPYCGQYHQQQQQQQSSDDDNPPYHR